MSVKVDRCPMCDSDMPIKDTGRWPLHYEGQLGLGPMCPMSGQMHHDTIEQMMADFLTEQGITASCRLWLDPT